jgi:hypothetical protein
MSEEIKHLLTTYQRGFVTGHIKTSQWWAELNQPPDRRNSNTPVEKFFTNKSLRARSGICL